MGIGIIVHGGAGNVPPELRPDFESGCRIAVETAWRVLAAGGSAMDAVETAVRVLEDNPVFDAGRGAHLNQDGYVELDAGMMDGRTLMAGAVASVRRITNPISLARRVLTDCEHVFLVGAGAESFAEQIGIPFCDPADLIVERELMAWEKWRSQVLPGVEAGATVPCGRVGTTFGTVSTGTVGAVALDAAGNLVVGNSTGGTAFKHPGRVGDTPIIGCGLYADNMLGAAACTGIGEQIMKTVLAKTTVDQIALLGDAATAASVAIGYFERRIGGQGGVICMSPQGQVGWAFSTSHMACAYRTGEMDATVATVGIRGQVGAASLLSEDLQGSV
jgi:beta-aspartyl-peptidase (threonine type)